MSDASQGPGWWLASDGKWYPPKEAEQPPAPGWWLASDGKWYPPKEAEQPPGPGWWLASDGKWYAPEARANGTTAAPTSRPGPDAAKDATAGRQARNKSKGSRRGRGRRGRGQPETARPESEPTPRVAPPPEPVATAATPARSAARPDAPAQDRIRPNLNEGISPLEQIERRNQASRADAAVLAAKRAEAASRALGMLQVQIDAERTDRAPSSVVVEPPPATITRPEPAPKPQAPAAQPPPVPQPVRTPAASEPMESAPPLLEVKTSPLGADLEHLGDRLAIFVDRVELRDRLDRVRNSIKGADIVDVTVHKRLTGAVLTVESVHGPAIAAKGLRPDQADEARRLIFEKTRRSRVADRNGDRASPRVPAAPPSAAPKSAAPKVDAAALRAKLADLHAAGVLTDDEYRQKLLVVGRLANGETPTASGR